MDDSKLLPFERPPQRSTTLRDMLGLGYEAFVGVRYLMAKRRADVVSIITVISVLGVAVGVMAMIVVLSVMGGFEADLKHKILGTKTHIVVLADEGDLIRNPDPLLDQLGGHPGVTGASPFIESEVMISSPTNLSGVLIKGIDPSRITQVSDLERNLVDGDLTYLNAAERIRPGRRGLSDPEELDRILDELEFEHDLPPIDGHDRDGDGRYVPGVKGRVYDGKDGRKVIDQGGGSTSEEFRRKFTRDPNSLSPTPRKAKPASTGQDNPNYAHDDVGKLYGDDPEDGFMPPLPGQAPSPDEGDNYNPGDVGELYNDNPEDGFMPPLPGQDDRDSDRDSATTMPPIDFPITRTRTRVPGIIIGRELKKSLQVDIGSEVNIVTPDGDMGPSGPIPRSRPFKVVGVFYSGMYEYDTKYVYLSIPDMQRFLDLDANQVTGIEVKTADVDAVTEVKDALLAQITKAGLAEGLRLRDWKDMNSNLFFALKLEKIVMFIILVFIILVASFSIVCNLVMVVIEKAREIAILKSMGASDKGVMRIFILEGTIIGAAGTLIGLILGVSCCLIIEFYGIRLDPDVYYINTLPVEMNLTEIGLIAISGIVISALATLYPSVKAARMTPVDGLRYE